MIAMSEKIHLMSNDQHPNGFVDRVPIPMRERIRDGFKAGGMFWIFAVLCAPIPLMHFLLVPLGLILGTLRAWDSWTSDAVFENGEAQCPRCQEKLKIERMPAKWPLKLLCPKCGYQLRLHETNVRPLHA